MAASMGAFLLAGGQKGKRYALPNSEIMIHQPSGGARGQATEIKIVAENILKTKKKLNEILAANTGCLLYTSLSLLENGDCYGYEIIKKIDEKSGNIFKFKEGTLYPVPVSYTHL